MKVFAETTDAMIQPVFEQGQALLIPGDEIIVGFKKDTTFDQAQEYLDPYVAEQGMVDMREHRKNTYILRISSPSDGRVYRVCQFFATLDEIKFAEPNHIVVFLNDPDYFDKFNKTDTLFREKIPLSVSGKPMSPREKLSPPTFASASPTWVTLASFDFEDPTFPPSGWEASWFDGATEATWGRTAYRSHSGSYSMYCASGGPAGVSPPGPVPINMDSYLFSPLIDLTSYEEVYIEVWFYAKNDLWPGPGGDLYDFPSVWVVDNDTLSGYYRILGVLASGDCTTDPTTASGWRKLLFRVPPPLRVANAFFAITYESDDVDLFEGAYLDDIRIVATTDVDTEFLSSDTYSGRQYELKNVGQIAALGNDANDLEVPEAWGLVSVSPDIVIAVIDEGVDLTHPDLNLVQGYDYDGTPGGGYRGSHGTACAGNVGAIGDNGTGVIGPAPNVKIMPVYMGTTDANFASAIDVAVLNGADVLSNSWGWVGAPSTVIENAISAALAAGRVVVFAAGNGPDRPPWTYDVAFPGNLTGTTDVICVGASSLTDEHKAAASSDGAFGWGSSYVGDGPDICTPSPWSYTTDIQGAAGYNDGTWLADPDYTPTFGGTSSSTPKLAGIVALMLSACPELTPAQVRSILRNTADDIDAPGFDDKTGGGRVNAHEAVLEAQTICGEPPDCLESLVGDKDGFGVGCPIQSGLHYLDYGVYGGDYREVDDPDFTDFWYFGDKSWTHDYTMPPDATSAQIEVFLAGIADIEGNASLLVNGQVVATIPYQPDWHDVTRLVKADVPIDLLTGSNQVQVAVAGQGDGYIVDYSLLTVCRGAGQECTEDDSGTLDIKGTAGGPGATMTITVRMQGAASAVDALGFEVAFDPALLTYTGFTRGSLVADFAFFDAVVPGDDPNVVRVGGFTTGSAIPAGASGDVIYLEFTVNQCDQGSSYSLELQDLKDDLTLPGWTSSGGCWQCGCSCDVSGDGQITPQDALCAFQTYLGICPTGCGPCEDICCDVTLDGQCTPADALEIFKEYLGLPSVCSP
jgi:hypothetical protein